MLELQEMLDDAAQLPANGRKIAPAQALHHLGQVRQIERAVDARRREPAQLRRLLLGPGVVIGLVERSLEHPRHRPSSRWTAMVAHAATRVKRPSRQLGQRVVGHQRAVNRAAAVAKIVARL
jgi:hypothetical protein